LREIESEFQKIEGHVNNILWYNLQDRNGPAMPRGLYVGKNRTETQRSADLNLMNYVGENRTEAQKVRDKKMSTYVGENRTEAQKIHDKRMSTYVGENRTEAQKIQDLTHMSGQYKIIILKHDNGDIISSKNLGIRKFCKKYNLNRSNIYKLINGKKTKYKKWKLLV
jgi:hypothetical protein